MSDFPGFLGFTSRGVIALHADWPAYPAEHGWGVALRSLGSFPSGTRFVRVDDIDQCVLFVVDGSNQGRDQFDPDGFHVAVWHDDLIDLAEQGLISGVEVVDERQWESDRRDRLRAEVLDQIGGALDGDPLDALFAEAPDGSRIPLQLPPLDDYDNEYRRYPHFDLTDSRISITSLGWMRLDELLRKSFRIPSAVQHRLLPVLGAELYDTALREAGVALEQRLRDATSTREYGQGLVEHYVDGLAARGRLRDSWLKVFRYELRTAFKFIRNEFAHSVVELDSPRAYALLSRLCDLISLADEIADSDC